MHSKLKELIANYKYEDIEGNFPVSKTDAEIRNAIVDLFCILDVPQDLIEIMDGYKTRKSDETTLRSLRELFDGLEDGSIEGKAEKKESEATAIEIEGEIFEAAAIFSISRWQVYDRVNSREQYQIILNKTTGTRLPALANTTFTFYTEEKRDAVLLSLSKQLSEMGILKQKPNEL